MVGTSNDVFTNHFSFSVQSGTSGIDEEVELVLVQNIMEFLKDETDEQNIYRAVVAIGTLVRQVLLKFLSSLKKRY